MPQEALQTNRSFTPYVLFTMAIIYALSPIDIIPDIPVIGWIDDGFVLTAAGLNLLEKGFGIQSQFFVSVLKFFRWTVILLGIIAVVLVAILAIAGVAVLKLISG